MIQAHYRHTSAVDELKMVLTQICQSMVQALCGSHKGYSTIIVDNIAYYCSNQLLILLKNVIWAHKKCYQTRNRVDNLRNKIL